MQNSDWWGALPRTSIAEEPMSSTIERITLTAPDISCGHCEATVREAVGALAGVSHVEPSAATKQVAVEFDQTRVSRQQIEAAMNEAGYPVRS